LRVPSSDFSPESEIWAMAPRGVAVFASRMDRGTLPFLTFAADPSHVDAAAGLLAGLRLPVALYAYSTTSHVMQLSGEDAFRRRIVERTQTSVVVRLSGVFDSCIRRVRNCFRIPWPGRTGSTPVPARAAFLGDPRRARTWKSRIHFRRLADGPFPSRTFMVARRSGHDPLGTLRPR
jgi:hypothetical protein